MKVYYEKSKYESLLNTIASLSNQYENVTGKAPNRIEMTKEELDALKDSLKGFKWFEKFVNPSDEFTIYGMEIIIEG